MGNSGSAGWKTVAGRLSQQVVVAFSNNEGFSRKGEHCALGRPLPSSVMRFISTIPSRRFGRAFVPSHPTVRLQQKDPELPTYMRNSISHRKKWLRMHSFAQPHLKLLRLSLKILCTRQIASLTGSCLTSGARLARDVLAQKLQTLQCDHKSLEKQRRSPFQTLPPPPASNAPFFPITRTIA